MIDDAVRSVLRAEGAATFVTNGPCGPHLVATWQSYVEVVDETTLIFPAGGYRRTEDNLAANAYTQLILGARTGTSTGKPLGYRLTGTAEVQVGTPLHDRLKARHSWCRAAVVVHVSNVERILG